jgi:hypothetical protein
MTYKIPSNYQQIKQQAKRRNKMKASTTPREITKTNDEYAARNYLAGNTTEVIWSQAAIDFMNCEDELARMDEEEFSNSILNSTDLALSEDGKSYTYR